MKAVLGVLKENVMIVLYTIMFFALFYGVVVATGPKYIPQLSLYYIVFISVYIFLKKTDWWDKVMFDFIDRIKNIPFPSFKPNTDLFLSILVILIIVVHLIDMGNIPVLKAWNSEDYYEIKGIRKDIESITTSGVRYFSFFAIKAIIPFTLLILFIRKKWFLYSFMLCLTSLYAITLMQKSFILTILFPLIVYTLLNKKWLYTAKYIAIVVSGIYILLYVTNPQLREIEIPEEVIEEQRKLAEDIRKDREEKGLPMASVSASERNAKFVTAIYTRVFLVPGHMVSEWFTHIPKSEPFLKGKGYRFLAPFLGEEYINYSQKLYPHLYPSYAKRGIQGNANAASFMYEYANFGIFGLVLSAVLLAFIFITIDSLFKDNFVFKISLNSLYILMLSSSALSTLLFSGGWGIIILLFLIIKPE